MDFETQVVNTSSIEHLKYFSVTESDIADIFDHIMDTTGYGEQFQDIITIETPNAGGVDDNNLFSTISNDTTTYIDIDDIDIPQHDWQLSDIENYIEQPVQLEPESILICDEKVTTFSFLVNEISNRLRTNFSTFYPTIDTTIAGLMCNTLDTPEKWTQFLILISASVQSNNRNKYYFSLFSLRYVTRFGKFICKRCNKSSACSTVQMKISFPTEVELQALVKDTHQNFCNICSDSLFMFIFSNEAQIDVVVKTHDIKRYKKVHMRLSYYCDDSVPDDIFRCVGCMHETDTYRYLKTTIHMTELNNYLLKCEKCKQHLFKPLPNLYSEIVALKVQ
jgi:hypothetical protein